jgi:HEAT repeat protein
MPLLASTLATRLSGLGSPADADRREREIRTGLEDESPAVREVAIAWAARCLEPAALAELVALPDNAVLRNAAIGALGRQGPYAVQHLVGMLGDVDPDVVMFACQVIGQIGDLAGAAELLKLLQHERVNVVQAAIEALGRIRAREATPRLIEILGEDPWLQLAATEALGNIGDRLAVPVLIGLVPESFVAEPALEALRKIGAPEAAEPLFHLLFRTDTLEFRAALVRALAASLAPGRTELARLAHALEADQSEHSLWRFLSDVLSGVAIGTEGLVPEQSEDDRRGSRGGGPTVRAAAAVVLGARLTSFHPAVVRWAADRDGVRWLQPLVRRFPGCLASTLPELLVHPDERVRQGALEVAEFREAEIPRLIDILSEEVPLIRAAACRALGALRATDAIRELVTLLTQGEGPDRDAAAMALGRMDSEALEPALRPLFRADTEESLQVRLLRIVEQSGCRAFDGEIQEMAQFASPALRRSALRVVGQMRGSRPEVLLLRALADRDESLQFEALDLLARRTADRVPDTLLALLNVNDSLRYHVIRALGRLGLPDAVGPLETLFSAAQPHEQIEIIIAMGAIAAPGVLHFLRECLGHPLIEIRRVTARALADLAGPAELPLLAQLAEDPDWAIRNEAARGLGRLESPESRAALLSLARDLEPVVARTARAALSETALVAGS